MTCSSCKKLITCRRMCCRACCSVLQGVLQCVEVRCGVLQYAGICCSVLQCVAVCCSVLQCTVVCCSVLQRVAAYCIVCSFRHRPSAERASLYSQIRAVPENPSQNFVCLYKKTKTFVGTDLFAFIQFGRIKFTKLVG